MYVYARGQKCFWVKARLAWDVMHGGSITKRQKNLCISMCPQLFLNEREAFVLTFSVDFPFLSFFLAETDTCIKHHCTHPPFSMHRAGRGEV